MSGIGKQLIDLYNKHRLRSLLGIDDWADRLNYFYTSIVLIVCITIVSTKTYFNNPLVCHVPTTPGGSNFKNYMTESCWVQGTTPLRPNENVPQNESHWESLTKERRTNYYYWIPFMLGLQLLLFYLPDVVWRCVTFNRLGANLTSLIEEANDARKCTDVKKRTEINNKVAESIKILLFAHRDIRTGLIADLKRKAGTMCGFLLASKRLGTWTVFSYLSIKCLYLINAIGQLYLMRNFLNFGSSMTSFGIELAQRISLRDDWKDSLYFPRTALCQVKLRLVGSSRTIYTGICALPVNLFNEKIYIFLWFWILFVAFCTAFSLPMWLKRLCIKSTRINRIKKYFLIQHIDNNDDSKENPYFKDYENRLDLEEFIDTFLRYDGIFIIDIINAHVGDIVTGEIVRLLWIAWTREYANRHDFRSDNWDNFLDELDSTEYSLRDKDNLYPNEIFNQNTTLQKRAPQSIKSAQI